MIRLLIFLEAIDLSNHDNASSITIVVKALAEIPIIPKSARFDKTFRPAQIFETLSRKLMKGSVTYSHQRMKAGDRFQSPASKIEVRRH